MFLDVMMAFDVVTVCDDDGSRRRGLRGRGVFDGECAAFFWDCATTHSFWNDGVPTDVWLSSVGDGGRVTSCRLMRAGSPEVVKTPPCGCALETSAPLPVGARVRFSGGYDRVWVVNA